MPAIINIDTLPQKTRKQVANYAQQLIKLHSENIISIFIYGSAAGTNYVHGKSDVNIAVILKDLKFTDLKKSLKLINWGIRKRIAAPLILTLRHIQTSTDIFPLEFLEMKDNNCLLYGQDLLSELPVSTANMRLQCEQELKGKLIRIRQAYLEIGLKKKGIEALLKESLSSLFPAFRALLRLKTRQIPSVDKEKIIKGLSDNFSIDSSVFFAILHDKKNDEKIRSKDIEPFFEGYINEIQKLAVEVDKLRA
ncbi:MAG: hypothetical protein V2A72_08565 [Candidatus Omnitrophota bacterium]